MIQKTTIISRFVKAFGEITPSTRAPFFVGKELPFFGITSKLKEVQSSMVTKYIQEYKTIPKLETTKPFNEYECTNGDFEIFFTEDRLLAGYHILDMKPFERITIRFFPGHCMPLAVVRELDDGEIAVLVAPQEVSKYVGNPWHDGKPVPRWIRRMKDSTFWLIEFDTFDKYGRPIGVENIIKCENCRVEMLPQDYANQIIQQQHPECMCTCNTYDDFCGCIRKRLYNQLMKESRELKFIKRQWRYGQ